MSSRRLTRAVLFASLLVFAGWTVLANGPKLGSDVATTADLEAEVLALFADVKASVASIEAYQGDSNKLRRTVVQLAVLAQALATHQDDSPLKGVAPTIRDAALRLRSASSYEQAKTEFERLQSAIDSKSASSELADFDWSKLAGTHPLMEVMRERGDKVRKAMRRSKDPVSESRSAMTMALIAQAIAAHAEKLADPDDRQAWNVWSLELQTEMSKTAVAIRKQDSSGALEHFTAAQAACDKCHEKFKK